MIEVKPYSSDDCDRWNAFIKDAKNGHFMFMREYMEYHAERFVDHSLLFEDKGRIVAVLPANRLKHTLHSHNGLTFGGMISGPGMTTLKMLHVFTALMENCRSACITKLAYKVIPHIYHNCPSDEDLYALTVNGARLVRRDVSDALDQENRPKSSKGHKYNLSKARRGTLTIGENTNFTRYWDLLDQVLTQRHGASAVHSCAEIQRLAELFPDNIRLFEVSNAAGQLVAGSVLYINRHVVHTQYLASSDEGRQTGALDYLINELINRFRQHRYFDFGISTTNHGMNLNEGLCSQKEGIGARAIVHDFYELDIA